MGGGAEDGQAAVRRVDAGLPLDRAPEKRLRDLARGRELERLRLVRVRSVRVAVERPVKQLLFGAEGGVEGGTIDAHRLAQVRERRAFVPETPEHENGLIECFVDVDLA